MDTFGQTEFNIDLLEQAYKVFCPVFMVCYILYLTTCLLVYYIIRTKNVDIDSGGGASTDVDCLNDVGGGVSSGGVGNGELGVSRLGVNGNAVICPQDQVGFCPFYPGIRFSLDISRKLDLSTSSGGQTSQQLHIELDLWRLCWNILKKGLREQKK